MKAVVVFMVLCTGAAVLAYPKPADDVVEKTDDSDEVDKDTEFVRVPLERSQPRRPSFGFGLAFPDIFNAPPPSFNRDPFFRGADPFGGFAPGAGGDGQQVDDFMTQMQDMLTEMRRQLTALVHHTQTVHGIGGENGTEVINRFGDDLPANKTTSTTKVIDGHVVTVNETTYSSGDDNMGAVFRIKIVDVKPKEGETDEVEIPEGPTDEKAEEPNNSEPAGTENETVNSKSELDEDKHEETNEIPFPSKVQYVWQPEFDPSVNEIGDEPQVYSVEEFTPVKREKYYDLTSDTRVNDYLSDQAESQGLVMIDPEAELLDTNTNSYYRYDVAPQQPQRLQRIR